jgi:transposase
MAVRLAALEAELAKAKKHSGNSSKPPSSDITNPPKAKGGGKGQVGGRGRSKRRRGGQPGHKRHDRTAFPPEDVDIVWEYRFQECPCCQGKLQDVDPAEAPPKTHQQVELIARPIEVTQHDCVPQYCPRCSKTHCTALPEDLRKAGLAGPRLTALVGFLKGACHMSYSALETFFQDVLRVKLSRGMLAKLVAKVSGSLADPYEEMLDALSREGVLYVDETGHKENGARLWTWCFRAATFTVFKIDPSRSSEVLVDVLGSEFNGLLGCDYFSAYRKYMRLNENVALQFCLAHLVRDVKFLADHPDAENRRHGKRLLQLLRKLFRTIHRRDEYASDAVFRRALERIRNELCYVAGLELPDTQDARNLAERFYLHCESYFRFITEPGIEPTNNLAEQAIRFVAIHRRLTQGTRSETGRQWFQRMASVVVTCRQQTRSLFSYLHTAVGNAFSGQPAPSLIPLIDTS